MTASRFQTITLSIAGIAVLAIGLAITLIPHAFYGFYGIDLGTNPSLLSELRAPGANLAALGVVILAGAFRPDLARISAALGAIVFLAHALGRSLSLMVDGMPDAGLVEALVFEVVAGGLCLAVFLRGAPVVGALRA